MKVVQKAYKFRIYPNVKQRILLAKTFGCSRFFWNKLVETYNNNKGKPKEDRTEFKSSTGYRHEFNWMQEVSAAALQQKEQDFYEYLSQRSNKKRKKQLGDPNFKKKSGKQSYRLLSPRFSLVGNRLRLEKLGRIKIVRDRVIPNDVKFVNVTVSKNPDGKYYASILVEEAIQSKTKTGDAVGIDVGLNSFAVTSDGVYIDNPRYFRKSQEKIAKLQRKQSRKKGSKKGEKKSRRWRKLQKRITGLYQKVRNQRQYFLHCFSMYLIAMYDIIVTEDLNVAGMMKNHCLAKSIGDAAWAELFRQIAYKAEWYGKEHRKIGRFEASTQTCSCCGKKARDKLTLDVRLFQCLWCGEELTRDFNSAKFVKIVGLGEALGVDSAIRTQRDMSSGEAFRVTLNEIS